MIDERLQEIKTSIKANARTLVAQIFWQIVEAGLTAFAILTSLTKAVFPFIKWIRQKVLSGIRDAKFIQALNAALLTMESKEPELIVKTTVKKKMSNGSDGRK